MSFTADVSFLRKTTTMVQKETTGINVLYSGRLISTWLTEEYAEKNERVYQCPLQRTSHFYSNKI